MGSGVESWTPSGQRRFFTSTSSSSTGHSALSKLRRGVLQGPCPWPHATWMHSQSHSPGHLDARLSLLLTQVAGWVSSTYSKRVTNCLRMFPGTVTSLHSYIAYGGYEVYTSILNEAATEHPPSGLTHPPRSPPPELFFYYLFLFIPSTFHFLVSSSFFINFNLNTKYTFDQQPNQASRTLTPLQSTIQPHNFTTFQQLRPPYQNACLRILLPVRRHDCHQHHLHRLRSQAVLQLPLLLSASPRPPMPAAMSPPLPTSGTSALP